MHDVIMSRTSTLRSVGDVSRTRLSPCPTPATCLSRAESLTQLDQSAATTSNCALHEACRLGNANDVTTLINSTTNINARDQLTRTALHWAAAGGHSNIVEILLSCGDIVIDLTDKVGMTALLWSAWNGHIDTVKLLVNRGANVLAVNTQGQSILHCAACNNQSDLLTFICNFVEGFDVNCTDKQQRTALHVAAYKGHVDIVDKLLSIKSEVVHVVDKYGWTPVHLAARGGHEDVLKKLLLYGVEIDQRDIEGSTALYLAAANGHHKLVAILLACNADQNIQNSKRLTPLMAASVGGHVTCARVLIENKCNLNATNHQGNTALHLAAINNQLKIVKLLLSARSDINIQNERSQTALHAAIESSTNADIVEILLSAGADLDVTEKGGRTALGLASRASMIGIVDLIITAERHVITKKTDVINSGLECGDHYHHCFYQTTCSALSQKTALDVSVSNDVMTLKHSNRHVTEFMKDILWKLATKQLRANEWKQLARHWMFSDAHVRAIEHQYTGTDSYRQHGYRLLLIWLHCLHKNDNPIKLLFEALVAVDRRELAEQIRTRCNIQVEKSTSADGFCHIS